MNHLATQHRLSLAHARRAMMLMLFAVSGCAGGAGSRGDTIIEAPGNWSAYENRQVTVEGSSANSPSGPFIRLADGARLTVVGFRAWPIDFVSRPIGATGKIVRGTDANVDRYVLALETYYRQKVTDVPVEVDTAAQRRETESRMEASPEASPESPGGANPNDVPPVPPK